MLSENPPLPAAQAPVPVQKSSFQFLQRARLDVVVGVQGPRLRQDRSQM